MILPGREFLKNLKGTAPNVRRKEEERKEIKAVLIS